MQKLAADINLPLTIVEGYDMPEFLRRVAGHYGERCGDCFDLRLTKTAAAAKEKGFDGFTTTLLISPTRNTT